MAAVSMATLLVRSASNATRRLVFCVSSKPRAPSDSYAAKERMKSPPSGSTASTAASTTAARRARPLAPPRLRQVADPGEA